MVLPHPGRRAAVAAAFACTFALAIPSAAHARVAFVFDPQPAAAQSWDVRDVAVVSGADAWAVGARVGAGGQLLTLVEHWDGETWQRAAAPAPPSSQLTSVSARAADDVWAVGYATDPSSGGDATLALHFDGDTWSRVPTPNQAGFAENELYGVAARHRGVYAVGSSSDAAFSETQTLVLQLDSGGAFQIIPSPNEPPPSTATEFVGITAGTRGIYAVGHSSDGAYAARLTRSGWQALSFAVPGAPGSSELADVTQSRRSVYAVGAWNGQQSHPLAVRFHRSSARVLSVPTVGGSSYLVGVTSYRHRPLAVGTVVSANLDTGQALSQRRTRHGWRRVPVPAVFASAFADVSSRAGSVVAVGARFPSGGQPGTVLSAHLAAGG